MNKEIIDELFTRINMIVYNLLSIQKILCIKKSESSEQMWNQFQSEHDTQIKVFENNHFNTLKEFYRKNVSKFFLQYFACHTEF